MQSGAGIRGRYPLGVVVVMFIAALRSIGIAVELLITEPQEGIVGWLQGNGPLPAFQPGSNLETLADIVLVGIVVASVLVVIGLLFGRHWAWVLAIVSSGFILALDLGWWFAGEPRYGSMLLNVIAVFYLNQRDVQHALRGGAGEP